MENFTSSLLEIFQPDEKIVKHQNKALPVEEKCIIQNSLVVPLNFWNDQGVTKPNIKHPSPSSNTIIA